MIIVYHNNKGVVAVDGTSIELLSSKSAKTIIASLFCIADAHPDTILVWCHITQKIHLNAAVIQREFHLKNRMMSYTEHTYLPKGIGYVEDSPFINVNTLVTYPTWLMSSLVGAIHSSVLLQFKNSILVEKDFDYCLNSMAKLGMANGLVCNSNPNLLKSDPKNKPIKASTSKLFRFVRQHYRLQWLFLLLVNLIIYERQFPILAMLKGLWFKRRTIQIHIATRKIKKLELKYIDTSIDVIIPTIGRKAFLFDVLKDLAKQELLPNQVIVIEQNPDVHGTSELDYLNNEDWPFKLVHEFTHQTGACNARNIAMEKVNAKYVFFADDDIRCDPQTLQSSINTMLNTNCQALTLSCLQKDETETKKQIMQWHSFGSGCSIVAADVLKGLSFDLALEHGFGEDVDFGMQIRNKGIDIIYTPLIKLQHLKANIGGFRVSVKQPWDEEIIAPKPAPTVMYHRVKNNTHCQLLGYKTVLFFKYYKKQSIKNPLAYFYNFKKQWIKSIYWSEQLMSK